MKIGNLVLAAAAGALASAVLPSPILAQSPACVDIEDGLARLDCYDRAAGRGRAAPQAQPSGQVAPPAPEPTPPPAAAPALPEPPVAAAPVPPVGGNAIPSPPFDSRIVAVERLRQGYSRMVMANGAAYQTTEPVEPLPVGTPVSLRRTLVGSSYIYTDGRRPLAVRRSRRP